MRLAVRMVKLMHTLLEYYSQHMGTNGRMNMSYGRKYRNARRACFFETFHARTMVIELCCFFNRYRLTYYTFSSHWMQCPDEAENRFKEWQGRGTWQNVETDTDDELGFSDIFCGDGDKLRSLSELRQQERQFRSKELPTYRRAHEVPLGLWDRVEGLIFARAVMAQFAQGQEQDIIEEDDHDEKISAVASLPMVPQLVRRLLGFRRHVGQRPRGFGK